MSAPPPAYYPPTQDYAKTGSPRQEQAPYPATQGQYPPPGPQQQYPPPQQYPPGPGYAAGQQQHTVVVAVPTVTVANSMMSNGAMQTICPNCHNSIVTFVSYEVGCLTWLIAGILCLVGCWLCAIIPFCVTSFKDVVHSCPSCSAIIGRHRRL